MLRDAAPAAVRGGDDGAFHERNEVALGVGAGRLSFF